jgi:O-antigen/teichoic acid export membrane protein
MNFLRLNLKNTVNYFSKKNKRTRRATNNILGSFFIKGLSILVSLILIPLTLNYLTPYDYGVWLTLSSVLLWLDYFDIGLGNGLRNKLTEALANNDMTLARSYVSTTFFALVCIVVIVFICFVFIQQWIDWGTILNVPQDLGHRVSQMIMIVFLAVCITFSLKFIGNIYLAKQIPIINNLISLLSQLFSFFIIWILTLFTKNNLEYVAYTYSFTPAIVWLLFYPITFYKYKELRPSLKSINLKYLRSLMSLGVQFFLIQLSCLLIYTTSNLIISNNLTPQDVTPYNIAFRYFNCVFMIFMIIIVPMWSAVNDAYVRNELIWIKNAMKHLIKIWLLLFVLLILMLLFSDFVYHIWIGENVKISFGLNLCSAAYITILTFSSLFSNFLNGMGKLKLQLIVIVIMGLAFIPLAKFMINKIGITGVVLALCFVNLPGAIFNYIQYKKVINGSATGIWAA